LSISRRAALINIGRFAWLAAILTGCAGHGVAPPPDVPPTLKVPDGQILKLALRGAGVQIYECRRVTEGATQFAWILRSPEADLTDHMGKTVGRHYAGPTWEADDGSTVVGEVIAQFNGPDASAIPWLLLRKTSNAGKGSFGKIRFIQRLHTVGGKVPSSACDAGQLGKRVRVPYSADYYFYASRK
jgi:hypothetical protein